MSKRLNALLIAMLLTVGLSAQELEYAMELGAMAGPSFYMGDANLNGFYKNVTMAGGLIGRYNINPRMALKFDLAYGRVKGDATNGANKFPENEGQKLSFNNALFDAGCQYEISFWGFGTGGGYKGHKRLTPYIQLGLGFTYGNDTFTMNIPLGFGVKYKVKPRWNVGVDWSMRFSMSDRLDGIEDPYRIKSGLLKNKDSYSWTMIYVSYDLCPKYRKCNND
ncbi:MAG: outer membrane beta-barrel protein [Prevotellaceae bacterium]|nr:outer membrane beta-barrel protein [Prevotellaceae bacterium]